MNGPRPVIRVKDFGALDKLEKQVNNNDTPSSSLQVLMASVPSSLESTMTTDQRMSLNPSTASYTIVMPSNSSGLFLNEQTGDLIINAPLVPTSSTLSTSGQWLGSFANGPQSSVPTQASTIVTGQSSRFAVPTFRPPPAPIIVRPAQAETLISIQTPPMTTNATSLSYQNKPRPKSKKLNSQKLEQMNIQNYFNPTMAKKTKPRTFFSHGVKLKQCSVKLKKLNDSILEAGKTRSLKVSTVDNCRLPKRAKPNISIDVPPKRPELKVVEETIVRSNTTAVNSAKNIVLNNTIGVDTAKNQVTNNITDVTRSENLVVTDTIDHNDVENLILTNTIEVLRTNEQPTEDNRWDKDVVQEILRLNEELEISLMPGPAQKDKNESRTQNNLGNIEPISVNPQVVGHNVGADIPSTSSDKDKNNYTLPDSNLIDSVKNRFKLITNTTHRPPTPPFLPKIVRVHGNYSTANKETQCSIPSDMERLIQSSATENSFLCGNCNLRKSPFDFWIHANSGEISCLHCLRSGKKNPKKFGEILTDFRKRLNLLKEDVSNGPVVSYTETLLSKTMSLSEELSKGRKKTKKLCRIPDSN